jgi:hypothetical protein
VINDDLIVVGSNCVGQDCVNNENLGFDTLRLKQNNTRIKFDDTSTGLGFPNNDWVLQANETASGGANRFMFFDDTAGPQGPVGARGLRARPDRAAPSLARGSRGSRGTTSAWRGA